METKKVIFNKKVIDMAKSMPLPVLVGIILIPGSFTVIGAYFFIKNVLKKIKGTK